MEQIVIVIHVLVSCAIIGLILLQQGKGAEMGASFGSGSSNTVFGPQGTGNILSHTTAWMVAVFFSTSLGLAFITQKRASLDLDAGVPSAEVVIEEKAVKEIPDAPADGIPADDVPATPPVMKEKEAAALQVENSAGLADPAMREEVLPKQKQTNENNSK